MMKLSNMILVAGAGRNVGKTSFICELISHFSLEYQLTGIKISPHIHQSSHENELIHQSDHFILWEESVTGSGKDSSRMLKAGAHKVYYIETDDKYLLHALKPIISVLNTHPVICESAALRKLIIPGLFFFIENSYDSGNNKNMDLREKADFVLRPSENSFNFNYRNIYFDGKRWNLLKTEG